MVWLLVQLKDGKSDEALAVLSLPNTFGEDQIFVAAGYANQVTIIQPLL